MKIPCSNCNQRLEIPEELAGQTIECPSCKASLNVPALEPSPPTTPKFKSAPAQTAPPKKSKSPISKLVIASFAGVAVVVLMLVFLGGPRTPDIPLIEAATEGDLDAVKQHIAAGTDLNQKDPNPDGAKATALGIAAALGHTEVAIALIEGGANVDQRDKDGSTPLHSAAFLCYPEIVQALLDKGADKNVRNNSGSTALESVEVPWEAVKWIYELLDGIIFKPLGAPLDYERIQDTRPKIAEILR